MAAYIRHASQSQAKIFKTKEIETYSGFRAQSHLRKARHPPICHFDSRLARGQLYNPRTEPVAIRGRRFPRQETSKKWLKTYSSVGSRCVAFCGAEVGELRNLFPVLVCSYFPVVKLAELRDTGVCAMLVIAGRHRRVTSQTG